MSTFTVETTISPAWLERKSKRELASIIWNNLDVRRECLEAIGECAKWRNRCAQMEATNAMRKGDW